jgi:hypothetical protein
MHARVASMLHFQVKLLLHARVALVAQPQLDLGSANIPSLSGKKITLRSLFDREDNPEL